MSSSSDVEKISEITQAVWLASSRKLREASMRERALVAKIAALAGRRSEQARSLATSETVEDGQVQSYSRWLRWTELERKRLNQALVEARVQLEKEQALARRAFGRNEAAKELVRRQAEARRTINSRKSYRD